MAYKIVLFKSETDTELSSNDSFWRAIEIKAKGFTVYETTLKSKLAMITDEMWVEFATEAEAALFKLTHL